MQNGFHHKSARSVFSLAHVATYTINTQEVLQDHLGTILLSPNLTAYVTGLSDQAVVSKTIVSIYVLSSDY